MQEEEYKIKEDEQIIEEAIEFITNVIKEDNEDNENNCQSSFHGKNVPKISIRDYIKRLIHYLNVWIDEQEKSIKTTGGRIFHVGILYIIKSDIKLTHKSVHRYIMTSTLLACKYIYDFYISNKFWSEVVGCSLKEVNKLELEFCKLLKWDFNIVSTTEIVCKKQIKEEETNVSLDVCNADKPQ
jgi:hypothetical protein